MNSDSGRVACRNNNDLPALENLMDLDGSQRFILAYHCSSEL